MTPSFPKNPPIRRDPVRVYLDGREVCDLTTAEGKREYAFRTGLMDIRQGRECAICLESFEFRTPTFDHEAGRGHGGGHRDDRIDIGGKWINAALCVPCQGLKGSKRYSWQTIDAKLVYVPVTK